MAFSSFLSSTLPFPSSNAAPTPRRLLKPPSALPTADFPPAALAITTSVAALAAAISLSDPQRRREQQSQSLGPNADEKEVVKNYFNNTGFQRWKKIYGDSTEDVNKVQLDIRLGHSKTVENALKMLNDDGPLEGVTVCDAGCGTGSLSIPLALEGAVVKASDISAAMVSEAKLKAEQSLQNAGTAGLKMPEFEVKDLESLDGKYDTVVCLDVLIHYPQEKAEGMIAHLASLAEEEESGGDRKNDKKKVEFSREQREWIRFSGVGRKKDFICLERVKGKIVNIMEGLELHTGVFSAVEQKRIVDFVYELQEKGRRSEFGERTYSEPKKWMRGKGRVTIQFGCCYNYAEDIDGNPPGILRNVTPDPIPNLFKVIIRRLIRWHVLPTSCVPDSCIVNIYEPGDCIPPHIDSHDFVRPFSTVSFLSECNILFGTNLKVEGEGEFSGSIAIPLPVGSVLVLNGNGADVAKHCVPAVPSKRISITFRKMDETKQPIGFSPEPDLQNIRPLPSQKENNRDKQQRREGRSSKKGNKYKGRPAGSHRNQPYDPETTPAVRLRQVIDARTVANNHNFARRETDSSERPYHSRP